MNGPVASRAKLLVVQHGNSVPKDLDPGRPLSEQGRYDIETLASHLKRGLFGQVSSELSLFHSGKLRAKQTAEIISRQLQGQDSSEKVDGIGPNDEADTFIHQHGLSQKMSQGDLLIVSHMPFISNLCSVLLTGSTNIEFDFTPGTIAVFKYEYEEWSMECLVRPETYNSD